LCSGTEQALLNNRLGLAQVNLSGEPNARRDGSVGRNGHDQAICKLEGRGALWQGSFGLNEVDACGRSTAERRESVLQAFCRAVQSGSVGDKNEQAAVLFESLTGSRAPGVITRRIVCSYRS